MNDDRNYVKRENLWDEQSPETGLATGVHAATELDNADELSPFPETVGSSDVIESVRDAEPYDAPTDPPVLPGGRDGIHVAGGFGSSVDEEAASDGPMRGDDDIRQEVLLALHNDSLASTYNLHARVVDGVVHLSGIIPSMDEADYVIAMLGNLPGVVDVVDNTDFEPAEA